MHSRCSRIRKCLYSMATWASNYAPSRTSETIWPCRRPSNRRRNSSPVIQSTPPCQESSSGRPSWPPNWPTFCTNISGHSCPIWWRRSTRRLETLRIVSSNWVQAYPSRIKYNISHFTHRINFTTSGRSSMNSPSDSKTPSRVLTRSLPCPAKPDHLLDHASGSNFVTCLGMKRNPTTRCSSKSRMMTFNKSSTNMRATIFQDSCQWMPSTHSWIPNSRRSRVHPMSVWMKLSKSWRSMLLVFWMINLKSIYLIYFYRLPAVRELISE